MKPFRILVFGKPGCDKCKVLNQRLDTLLAKEEWADFEKLYCDVTTEDGLVQFARAECVNPQRIPAFMITRRKGDTDRYEPVMARKPGEPDPICKQSKLYQHLGLQTDYTDAGKGVISAGMITAVLEEARRA